MFDTGNKVPCFKALLFFFSVALNNKHDKIEDVNQNYEFSLHKCNPSAYSDCVYSQNDIYKV